ncbi:VOC family protein [Paenibacillus gansuensis]|uniref:VOC family protein n=1 Tax=Paenibacillus gansuensis TaxID=306542 RepID=A0ABW5PKC5_9BACL
MTNTKSLIKGIGQVSIPVRRLNESADFYRDVLGLQELFRMNNMALFDCGGIHLLLGIAEKPEFDHKSSIIYFNVDSIHEAYDRLCSAGVTFTSAPHKVGDLGTVEIWLAFFTDPDDNVHAIRSEISKS